MNMTTRTRTVLVLLCGALILGVFNVGIQAKERILRDGQTVLLELAPRDPRSIMQGDYMRLAYQVERDAHEVARDLPRNIRRGHLVIDVGQDRVASFARIDNGAPLKDSQMRVRFHRPYQRVEVVPRSFMFQEGHREFYEEAKYGIFKFDGTDSYLLTGLADENRQEIIPPKTPN